MVFLFGGGVVVGVLGMKYFSNKFGGGVFFVDLNVGGVFVK